MTSVEIKIAEAMNERAHISRLARSASFVEGLAAKPDKAAYQLNETKRKWLFDLLHKYRKAMPELHDLHCQQCREKALNKVSVVQLALF